MKVFYGLLAILTISITAHAQPGDFYSLAIQTLDGKTVSLNSYQGKKILFIVLPLSEADSAKVNQLLTFKSKYQDKIAIVGILSEEDGYTINKKGLIEGLYYNSRNWNLIITEGILTRKSSGVRQSPFMQWLTKREYNHHFDADVRGIGQKYFVDETGKLYAVVGPGVSLLSQVIDRIVKTVPAY
jgi:hypothetical protein